MDNKYVLRINNPKHHQPSISEAHEQEDEKQKLNKELPKTTVELKDDSPNQPKINQKSRNRLNPSREKSYLITLQSESGNQGICTEAAESESFSSDYSDMDDEEFYDTSGIKVSPLDKEEREFISFLNNQESTLFQNNFLKGIRRNNDSKKKSNITKSTREEDNKAKKKRKKLLKNFFPRSDRAVPRLGVSKPSHDIRSSRRGYKKRKIPVFPVFKSINSLK